MKEPTFLSFNSTTGHHERIQAWNKAVQQYSTEQQYARVGHMEMINAQKLCAQSVHTAHYTFLMVSFATGFPGRSTEWGFTPEV